jgi:hypothetical protein
MPHPRYRFAFRGSKFSKHIPRRRTSPRGPPGTKRIPSSLNLSDGQSETWRAKLSARLKRHPEHSLAPQRTGCGSRAPRPKRSVPPACWGRRWRDKRGAAHRLRWNCAGGSAPPPHGPRPPGKLQSPLPRHDGQSAKWPSRRVSTNVGVREEFRLSERTSRRAHPNG